MEAAPGRPGPPPWSRLLCGNEHQVWKLQPGAGWYISCPHPWPFSRVSRPGGPKPQPLCQAQLKGRWTRGGGLPAYSEPACPASCQLHLAQPGHGPLTLMSTAWSCLAHACLHPTAGQQPRVGPGFPPPRCGGWREAPGHVLGHLAVPCSQPGNVLALHMEAPRKEGSRAEHPWMSSDTGPAALPTSLRLPPLEVSLRQGWRWGQRPLQDHSGKGPQASAGLQEPTPAAGRGPPGT